MSRIGPRRTLGEQTAEAIDTAERLFPGKYWVFAKGKTRAAEPLFGFAVFEIGDADSVIAEGEHDDPVEAVMRAIDQRRSSAS